MQDKITGIAPLLSFHSFVTRKRNETKNNDAEIHFRDLVVRCKKQNSFGEVNKSSCFDAASSLYRLCSHIEFLFHLVNEDHKANYYALDGQRKSFLREINRNKITRLSTSEFFFIHEHH